uniref:Loquacious-PA n=1 Tax=Nezara viridula TaxID=85310 RepID=A0A2P1DMA1_NEZVI|nr:Loquacious-PA [Nezara viridula]
MRSNTHNTRTIQPSEPIPLEEAAKRELQAMPTKTPVSMLQELLSRRGTTPKYELVQVEGAIHEPTFRYTVSVGETIGSSRFAAMGTGRSKKEAKHAAAKAILDKITGNTEPLDICSPASTTDSIGSNIGAVEERMMGNPIGLLQELCMTRRWPPPAYETENEEGLPHERQFTISCLVFRHKEIGTGKSKKIAKRLAAHKMWMRLKDLPCESNTIHYGLDDEDEIISLKDSDFNAVQFLQEIAAEQQFEVTFVDVEEKSVTGKCQSLVQLSTLPVAVCYGTGMSSSEAQTCAAYNALQYLKLMTKK